MHSVLVAGGAGYIGSHVAKALSAAGFLPVVIDDLSTGNRRSVQWGPFIEARIDCSEVVRRLIEEHNVDAVIHLAAKAYVGESVINPRSYYRNNVIGSLELLDTLLQCGIDKLVFSSTCAVYGESASEFIDESHEAKPINPYGESKLFIERALHGLGVAHGLRSVCLRYFNAAGADPAGEIGEKHDPETHLIPLVIQTAQGKRDVVKVFGSDYKTPDGSAVRDYTHVSDLAGAHVLALQYLYSGEKSTTVNLGTGFGHSVLDVIHAVESAGGRDVPRVRLPARHGDPARLVASNERARQVLGWHPRYPELSSMVNHALQWHATGFREKVAVAV